MMSRTLRIFLIAAAALGITQARAADRSTLRIVLDQEVRIVDPTFTSTYSARDHGFLIYDQLFAYDHAGVPKPEMVDTFTVSDDKLTYTFKLRPGLVFSDGVKVKATDAIASIRRWAIRDTLGRAMMDATNSLSAVDDDTFKLVLKAPFNSVFQGLARNSGYPLLVMPERVANGDPNQPITDTTGSGPYVFQRADWRPGSKAIYLKNPNYVPRAEPADGLAGGKVAKFERIEWLSMPDPNTAVAALQNGEIDFDEQPPLDFMSVLEGDPAIKTVALSKLGNLFILRPNTSQPPFDNEKMRQALIPAVDQLSVLQSIGAPPSDYIPYCPAMFMCGGVSDTRAGAPASGKPDYAKAKALFAAAGYKGEKIVFMQPTDHPLINPASSAVIGSLRKAGLNIEVASMDWQSIVSRRNSREPISKGGWNLFIAFISESSTENPLTNLYLASPCPNSFTGFLCDQKLTDLETEWSRTTDPEKAKALLDQIQIQAYQSVPYIPLGQVRPRSAYRADLKGLITALVPVFWNVER